MNQPLTAFQAARRLGIGPGVASCSFWELAAKGVTECLNPSATANRLHWLTSRGVACRDRICRDLDLPPLPSRLPDIPWPLYAELLFRHRAAVVLAMERPMRPSEIRRRAVLRDPQLRMSANNARDVVRFLVEKKVARQVILEKLPHPHYELTDVGVACRRLIEPVSAR